MNKLVGIILWGFSLFSIQCDIEIKNKGIGGNSTFDLIDRVENDVIHEKPNLVVLLVGTNDMVNSHKMIAYDIFASNLNKLISLFKENDIDIILVSPPPVDTVYLFERHDKKTFTAPPNEKLETASKILKNLAIENDLSFIDIFQHFKEIGIPKHNTDLLIRNAANSGARDGIHPTPIGYQIIARKIFKELVNKGKIKRGIKIICLGDSITFGVHVAGEGTTAGKTYPAYLNEMICSYLYY